MGKEFRIGFFVTVILAVSFALINFLRGKDIFNREMTVISHYDDVAGLVPSAPVYVKGYKAGTVTGVEYDPQTGMFEVSCSVLRDFRIPADSRMTLYSTDIMGGKGIRIDLGTSDEAAANRAVLEPYFEQDFMSTVTSGIGPLAEKVSSAVDSLSAAVENVNRIMAAVDPASVSRTLAHIESAMSEVEALYKDMVAHDNVSANMAALTFQANINTMEVQNLEQLFSLGAAEQQRRFWRVMQAQSVLRSNFGMQLVNKGDQLHNTQYSFGGLAEVYESMCLNLCGASHYPMTKLFGRSPAGMNATGESDLRNYYDYVDSQREAKLRPVLEKLLPVLAMSAWGAVPEDLQIDFPPLWAPTAREVAEIAKAKAEAIVSTYQAGLLNVGTAQKELKKLEGETGLWGSLTDEEIAQNAGKSYADVTSLRDPLVGYGLGETPEEAFPFEGAAQDAAVYDYPGQPREKNGRFAEGKMSAEAYKKPAGFTKRQTGEKTLDKVERERYDNLLRGAPTSDGVTIRGFREHAYDRTAQRGISPGQIYDAIQATPSPSKSDPACYTYDRGGIRVVVNHQSGDIVSVMKRGGAK